MDHLISDKGATIPSSSIPSGAERAKAEFPELINLLKDEQNRIAGMPEGAGERDTSLFAIYSAQELFTRGVSSPETASWIMAEAGLDGKQVEHTTSHLKMMVADHDRSLRKNMLRLPPAPVGISRDMSDGQGHA